MIHVDLYAKEDCHLCDIAHATLERIRRSHPFDLTVINIQEGQEHFDEFKERIPVIFINKTFAFQHRVPEHEFIAKLSRFLNES